MKIFKEMIEVQDQPVLVIEKSGNIVYINKRAVRLIKNRYNTEYSNERKSLSSIFDLTHSSSIEKLKTLIDEPVNTSANNQHSETRIAILQDITGKFLNQKY